ncbi:hypothetical protein AB4Z14_13900 [Terrabacter sp. 2TAF16]|uniref:hypothetical protein n=1 Tax=Terrabacter sp. 2TAF16 TaxID=3233008 RepID=UPI003F94AE16
MFDREMVAMKAVRTSADNVAPAGLRDTGTPWTQVLGFAALEVAFLMGVGTVIANSGDHRNWWIAVAVVTQLVLVGAVVEAFRRRKQHRSRQPHE